MLVKSNFDNGVTRIFVNKEKTLLANSVRSYKIWSETQSHLIIIQRVTDLFTLGRLTNDSIKMSTKSSSVN